MSGRDSPFASTLFRALILALIGFTLCPSCAPVSDPKRAVNTESVTRIEIAHTACFGFCPVYDVAFGADGNVRYTGKIYVARKGVHTGKVARVKFQELAEFILNHGFMHFKAKYSSDVTDGASVITTVVVGAKSNSITDYAGNGPNQLKEIENKIDSLMTEVIWDDGQTGAATSPGCQRDR